MYITIDLRAEVDGSLLADKRSGILHIFPSMSIYIYVYIYIYIYIYIHMQVCMYTTNYLRAVVDGALLAGEGRGRGYTHVYIYIYIYIYMYIYIYIYIYIFICRYVCIQQITCAQ